MLLRLIINKKRSIKDNKLETHNFQETKIITIASWYKEVANITAKWVSRSLDRIFQSQSLGLLCSNYHNKSNQITMTWMKILKHGWIIELNYCILEISIKIIILFYQLNKWNKSRSFSSCFIWIDYTQKRTNYLITNKKITILVKKVKYPRMTWFRMNKLKN